MANTHRALGARPKGELKSANSYVAAGAIYPGDFVSQESGGRVTAASASSALCGVALTYASGAGVSVLIADSPHQRFIVSSDDANPNAQTDIGLNYNIVAASPDTTYKVSRMELDGDTGATTATLPLKLFGVEARPDNALGTNADCIVTINNHQFATGTGTTGV